MRINPISNNHYQSKNTSSPNFGVNLMATQEVLKFTAVETINKGVSARLEKHVIEQLAHLKGDKFTELFQGVMEKVKDIKPNNLPIALKLTPKAQTYTNGLITGKMFDENEYPAVLQMPHPLMPHAFVYSEIPSLEPDAELEDNLLINISSMAALYKKFRPDAE